MPRPLLPPACASGLNLTAEPISQWTDDGDLTQLLSSGILLESTNDHYARSLYEDGRRRFLAEAKQFRDNALRSPDELAQAKDVVPHFEDDAWFGWMAKHAIAFDGVLNAMLSDGAFGSLPHLLEADSDLTCSVMLASNMYYKQALQALRGVLELAVAQVHFVSHPADFHAWVDGTWRTPNMRGSKGWLASLRSEGALVRDLEEHVAKLYGDLNSSVHAGEVRFVHTGLTTGRWSGHQFKEQQFSEWCALYGKSVSVTLRLLAQMLANQENIRKPANIECDVCHHLGKFEVVSRNDSTVTLRCRVCSAEHGYRAKYAAEFGY